MGLELIPLALRFAPWIANLIFGGAAEQAVDAVIKAARKAFGTTDTGDIERQISADSAKADMFKAELQAHRESLEAVLKDIQSARAQTVDLARIGSPIAWGAPIMSIIVTFGFFAVITFYFFGTPPASPVHSQILNVLVGTMAAGFTATIGYWLGSTSSSKAKDIAIVNSVPASVLTPLPTAGTPSRVTRPVLRRTP